MHTFILGGTSGLGHHLGLLLESRGDVTLTGRVRRFPTKAKALGLNVTDSIPTLAMKIDEILETLPPVDLLIFAAGFYEQGHIDELSEEHIIRMLNLGLMLPTLFLRGLMLRQRKLSGFIMITSTSQWREREMEPVYTTVKAGAGMFARSLSKDRRIKKVLVAGPAGMDTPFWEGRQKDTTGYLAPGAVAQEILRLWDEDFEFREVRIDRPLKSTIL